MFPVELAVTEDVGVVSVPPELERSFACQVCAPAVDEAVAPGALPPFVSP